ncbi:hypothetical protein [Streptomyces beijiangensis]|uniref:Uncharacterized protein n=1 Tax=Streptomyces beijiangensis TaxID=163361 RepID=A0A939F898_9ACTN|nr:hypothetical protein [Streptomyces beijiangensis]MBO0512787.1 hypothetical protein [Streptomyces beijiangensis]
MPAEQVRACGFRDNGTALDPTGILLTQVGASVPDPVRLMHDFWTTLYQAIGD